MPRSGIARLYGSFRASQMVLVVKNPPANAGDVRDLGLIPQSGRSPGGGHGNPGQYSCLENLMNREAWWAAIHRVAKRWTRLKWISMPAYMLICAKNFTRDIWCTACSETGWYQGADGEDLIFIFKFLSNEHIWCWYWKKRLTQLERKECLGPRS